MRFHCARESFVNKPSMRLIIFFESKPKKVSEKHSVKQKNDKKTHLLHCKTLKKAIAGI